MDASEPSWVDCTWLSWLGLRRNSDHKATKVATGSKLVGLTKGPFGRGILLARLLILG